MFEVWAIANNIYRCLDTYKSHAVYRVCIIRLTMAPQATAALKMAVLHLRKSGKSIKSVCQQTGVIERTKRRWITAAKKAGTWEELVSPAPRKQRSARSHWRKVTGVMVCAIKRRLSYNPRLTANDLRSLVPGLDVVSRPIGLFQDHPTSQKENLFVSRN